MYGDMLLILISLLLRNTNNFDDRWVKLIWDIVQFKVNDLVRSNPYGKVMIMQSSFILRKLRYIFLQKKKSNFDIPRILSSNPKNQTYRGMSPCIIIGNRAFSMRIESGSS